MDDITIEEILEKLDIFEKTYESIRVVDPVNKIVLSNNKENKLITTLKCFDFWGKNKMCDNCVSMRAYNENKTFVKVEYNSGAIFMFTAIPYDLKNRRVVIELLKDATESLIFSKADDKADDKSEIYELIDNMNKLSLRDPLTGIYNRRYINEKLPIDLISSLLLKQKITIMIADIDFFKKVNDNYGHLVGDKVLKIFAETIRGCLNRTSDWVARYGGEEFLICLPGANQETVLKMAEMMRKAIEEKEIIHEDKKIRITASFGIYSIVPSEKDNLETIIKIADDNLYLAKENGRNRIEY